MVTPVEDRPASAEQAKPPFWRNITIVKWAAQIGVLAAFVWLAWTLVSEATTNLEVRGIPFSWDFLGEPHERDLAHRWLALRTAVPLVDKLETNLFRNRKRGGAGKRPLFSCD